MENDKNKFDNGSGSVATNGNNITTAHTTNGTNSTIDPRKINFINIISPRSKQKKLKSGEPTIEQQQSANRPLYCG